MISGKCRRDNLYKCTSIPPTLGIRYDFIVDFSKDLSQLHLFCNVARLHRNYRLRT